MSLVLLDIGASSKKFAQLFRKFNSSLNITYLCGEPEWKRRWNGESCPNKILTVHAKYSDFGVKDSSLSILTLNASHPMRPPFGIEEEAARTLRPGTGIFISAHPVGSHPNISNKYFSPVTFTRRVGECCSESYSATFDGTYGTFIQKSVCGMNFGDTMQLLYPASPTIQSRLIELGLPEELRVRNSSYCYSGMDAFPSIMVWMRNMETV